MPTLRARLASGEVLPGAWLQLPGALHAEVVGRCGFAWVGIDRQHGMIGYADLVAMLQAVALSGTPAVVRVSCHDAGEIGRALDAGAAGVIVPLVETAGQARAAVAACRYAPAGRRSWGPIRPALAEPGLTTGDGDGDAACVLLVETAAGIEAIEEIVAVAGVDAVLVGPSDLAIATGGVPAATLVDDHHADALVRVRAACADAGLPFGAITPAPGLIAPYLAAGCRLVAVHRDIQATQAAARWALSAAAAATTAG